MYKRQLLLKVKEVYAEELGYKDWETCLNDQPNHKVEILMNEVALRLFSQAISQQKDVLMNFADWLQTEMWESKCEDFSECVEDYIKKGLMYL